MRIRYTYYQEVRLILAVFFTFSAHLASYFRVSLAKVVSAGLSIPMSLANWETVVSSVGATVAFIVLGDLKELSSS